MRGAGLAAQPPADSVGMLGMKAAAGALTGADLAEERRRWGWGGCIGSSPTCVSEDGGSRLELWRVATQASLSTGPPHYVHPCTLRSPSPPQCLEWSELSHPQSLLGVNRTISFGGGEPRTPTHCSLHPLGASLPKPGPGGVSAPPSEAGQDGRRESTQPPNTASLHSEC
ncbi:phosphomannomutase 2 [Platysternon megacephalum]|uniref:Phosphomannomutase 2 n=1 Tax=Platysternon megacephalum TaxID=55544 RepID=A0A4D9EM53_9SAUR|nr:phosphomannomutase 2 [Platysternon megacephalum]